MLNSRLLWGQVVSAWDILLQRKPKLGRTKPSTGPHAARGLDIAALESLHLSTLPLTSTRISTMILLPAICLKINEWCCLQIYETFFATYCIPKLLSKFTQYFLNNLSSYKWIRDPIVQPSPSSFTPRVYTLSAHGSNPAGWSVCDSVVFAHLQCGIDSRTSGRMECDIMDVNSTPDESAKESSYFHVHGSHL